MSEQDQAKLDNLRRRYQDDCYLRDYYATHVGHFSASYSGEAGYKTISLLESSRYGARAEQLCVEIEALERILA